MENIHYYIELSKELENISDGGSKCYDVGDGKVLVCYCIDKKYNTDPRRDAEEIAFICNQKNDEGVNVPKQYEIKRLSDDTYDYCYVLEEKAKGVSFRKYCDLDKASRLDKQREMANLSLKTYIKCARDMASIMHMGIEVKPKNIFFDSESEEFSFIDFLEPDGSTYDGSLEDFFRLDSLCSFIANSTLVYDFDDRNSDINKKSSDLYHVIKAKTFLALKNTVPNFDGYERFLVRSYDDDFVSFLISNKLVESDLALTDEEIKLFDSYCDSIAEDSLSRLMSGENQFWDIESNHIRIQSDRLRLGMNYRFHPQNTLDRNTDYYDFISDCKKQVEGIIREKLYDKVLEVGENCDSQNFKEAYAVIKERRNAGEQKK